MKSKASISRELVETAGIEPAQGSRRRYRTIVVDPPWPYKEGFAGIRGPSTRPEKRAGWRPRVVMHRPTLPYPAFSVEQITQLPIPDLAARDCRIFLWTTQRYLPDAFGVLAAWRFNYRQTLVWNKATFNGAFGGSIAPNNIEFVLVGRRGAPPVITRLGGCLFDGRGNVGRGNLHSAKPDTFLDLVEQVSPGPYAELFARRARLGWDYPIGDQALGGAVA